MRPALAVILLSAMLVPQTPSPDRLLLGVMRRDGVIVPFAFFDGDWSSPWPTGLQNLELPVTLDAVPKKWWGGEMAAAWAFWPIGKSESVRVTPIAPAVVMAGRERRLGLRTGVSSGEPLPTPFELPFPKEGLAVTGDVKVEPIPIVSGLSAAWREMAATLQEDALAAEQKAVQQLRSSAGWIASRLARIATCSGSGARVLVQFVARAAWIRSLLHRSGEEVSAATGRR